MWACDARVSMGPTSRCAAWHRVSSAAPMHRHPIHLQLSPSVQCLPTTPSAAPDVPRPTTCQDPGATGSAAWQDSAVLCAVIGVGVRWCSSVTCSHCLCHWLRRCRAWQQEQRAALRHGKRHTARVPLAWGRTAAAADGARSSARRRCAAAMLQWPRRRHRASAVWRPAGTATGPAASCHTLPHVICQAECQQLCLPF